MTGSELKGKRLKLELTQEQLAAGLGVDRNTVARWERSERAIPPYLELALKCLPQGTKVSVKRTRRPKKPSKKKPNRNKAQDTRFHS